MKTNTEILSFIKLYLIALESGREIEDPYPEDDFYSGGIEVLEHLIDVIEGIGPRSYETFGQLLVEASCLDAMAASYDFCDNIERVTLGYTQEHWEWRKEILEQQQEQQELKDKRAEEINGERQYYIWLSEQPKVKRSK